MIVAEFGTQNYVLNLVGCQNFLSIRKRRANEIWTAWKVQKSQIFQFSQNFDNAAVGHQRRIDFQYLYFLTYLSNINQQIVVQPFTEIYLYEFIF